VCSFRMKENRKMLFAYSAFLVLIVKCARNNHSHCQAAHWGWCESYENWQRTGGKTRPHQDHTAHYRIVTLVI